MIRAAIVTAIAAPLIGGFFVASLVAGGTTSTVTQTAEVGCTTALGEQPTPESTIADLAGAQAADALSAEPELARAVGSRAVAAVNTLFTLTNWRDLDRIAVAAWVANPSAPLPAGAAALGAPPAAATANSEAQLQDAYLAQCQHALDALTDDQLANFLAPPANTTNPSVPTSELHRAAIDGLGTQVTPNLATFVAEQLGRAAGTPLRDLLWTGARVPPAFIAPGDLIFFDFGSDGPRQLGIVIDASTVATTANLDGATAHLATLRTAPLPSINVVFIRPADPVRTTE